MSTTIAAPHTPAGNDMPRDSHERITASFRKALAIYHAEGNYEKARGSVVRAYATTPEWVSGEEELAAWHYEPATILELLWGAVSHFPGNSDVPIRMPRIEPSRVPLLGECSDSARPMTVDEWAEKLRGDIANNLGWYYPCTPEAPVGPRRLLYANFNMSGGLVQCHQEKDAAEGAADKIDAYVAVPVVVAPIGRMDDYYRAPERVDYRYSLDTDHPHNCRAIREAFQAAVETYMAFNFDHDAAVRAIHCHLRLAPPQWIRDLPEPEYPERRTFDAHGCIIVAVELFRYALAHFSNPRDARIVFPLGLPTQKCSDSYESDIWRESVRRYLVSFGDLVVVDKDEI